MIELVRLFLATLLAGAHSRRRLVVENLMLRQQLLVRPETVLRWHRQGWRFSGAGGPAD